MPFENFFPGKTFVTLFINLQNCRKQCEGTIKACVIKLEITWVSNYTYPITKTGHCIPVIGHLRDCTPIT